MTKSDYLLIRAARGEKVERAPVWAMRQAGRWDPEFNRLRAGLGFYEFSENVELAAEASLLPRRFGVDGIILFYDITTLPVAMGLPFTLEPGRGPQPDRPVRRREDVEGLLAEPDPSRFSHVRGVLARVRDALASALPVLVFAGAPFTVASYCIGTGKDVQATRAFAADQPTVWEALLERVQAATVFFLRRLVADGADLYQVFDSWAGHLAPEEYQHWAQTHHRSIFTAVRDAPGALFVKECPYLDLMVQSGAQVVSLGQRHDLALARRTYPKVVFQGNVDMELLRTGKAEEVAAATRLCVEQGGGQRHIVNLNHGVGRDTPVENFQAFVEAARAAQTA